MFLLTNHSLPYKTAFSCFSSNFYRPQRSCGQGNIFTGVCLSTGGGGCLPQCMLGCHTPPGMENPPPPAPPIGWRTPPDGEPPRMETPPEKQTPAYGLRAAGTHPTGMHSCFLFFFVEQWMYCSIPSDTKISMRCYAATTVLATCQRFNLSYNMLLPWRCPW